MSQDFASLARLIRANILEATTAAGSGHPSSSLSAVELMATLYFGEFLKFNLDNPDQANNDRVIFSKGHASPLFYALYAAAGQLSLDELKTLRKIESDLEGHPTPRFKYTEAATGSLGQGLSIGVGMALNAKYLDKLSYKTYVLLGDGELMEGQNWEAMEIAAHYQLDNLIGILDVNRLGQVGETSSGWQIDKYQRKIESFGWETVVVDGHDVAEIRSAYQHAQSSHRPTMIIARTVKGKGVAMFENEDNWHGKVLSKDQLQVALSELGEVDRTLIGQIAQPEAPNSKVDQDGEVRLKDLPSPQSGEEIAVRQAYGDAISAIGESDSQIVVLDADVANSTHAQTFAQVHPDRFFEMFIGEQNMVSVALGLSQRGKKVFASTFGAFLTRAFDQIRMAQYSQANLNLVGSHVGVSIGADGASQMALEDIAMMRAIRESTVLYPSDAVSTHQLVKQMAASPGISYLRVTRAATPVIYDQQTEFKIGGSQVLRTSGEDQVTLVAAGITLHESLAAYDELLKEGIRVRVIDLYSIKPLDSATLVKAAQETQAIITVEDHYPAGGLGEAVKTELVNQSTPIYSLAVNQTPHSGQPAELLGRQGIDAAGIIKKVKETLDAR